MTPSEGLQEYVDGIGLTKMSWEAVAGYAERVEAIAHQFSEAASFVEDRGDPYDVQLVVARERVHELYQFSNALEKVLG